MPLDYYAIFDYHPDKQEWTVIYPDFPECAAVGKTVAEVSSRGADELHYMISRMLHVVDLPIPSTYYSLQKEIGWIDPGSIVKIIRVVIRGTHISLGPYLDPEPRDTLQHTHHPGEFMPP